MESLLQLPQNIWRDNIVLFIPKVEELVRLDSAVMNTLDRTAFLSNMSGSRRFCHIRNKSGKIKWFTSRNLIVKMVCFPEELQPGDVPHLQQLLAEVSTISFLKNALSDTQSLQLFTESFSGALTTLCLMACSVVDLSAISVCHSLFELSILECPNLTNDSFVVGIQGCVKLTCCSLHKCVNLREGAVVALLQTCVKLERLSLRGSYNFPEIVAETTASSSLISFSSNDEQSVLSGPFIRAIAIMAPTLVSMALRYSYSTIGDGDIHFLVQNCNNLSNICWQYYTSITNAALVCVAQHLLGLKELYIDYCRRIADPGVIALAQSATATNLCKLRLTSLDATDVALQAIGTHCSSLQILSVQYCHLLTDSAFSTLNMSNLMSLDVSGTRVTGTFATHVFSATSALLSLDIMKCSHLSADFVHSLAPLSNKLLSLRVGGFRLSESDWMQLSVKFPSLAMLEIKNIPEMDSKIISSFKAHCASLRHVTMEGYNV